MFLTCVGIMQSDFTSAANVNVTAYCEALGNVPGTENPDASQRYISRQGGFRDRRRNRPGGWDGRHVSTAWSSRYDRQQVITIIPMSLVSLNCNVHTSTYIQNKL